MKRLESLERVFEGERFEGPKEFAKFAKVEDFGTALIEKVYKRRKKFQRSRRTKAGADRDGLEKKIVF